LAKLAQELSLSSHLYRDSFVKAISGVLGTSAFARSITHQLDQERGLLLKTGGLLEQIAQSTNLASNTHLIASANAGLARLAQEIMLPQSSLAGVFADRSLFQDTLTGLMPRGLTTAAIAGMDLSRSLSVSLISQQFLAGMDDLDIGRLVGIDETFRKATLASLGNLSSSYESLIHAVRTSGTTLPAHVPLVIRYPAVEYYREIAVIESITPDNAGQPDASIEEEVSQGLPGADDLLTEFNNSLCGLLVGARRSAKSDNPDRVRHVTTSLRELVTQVLHGLAPDEHIRKWTADPGMFHDNRPTRRARLLYIVRDLDCDPLAHFVEQDVDAALSFVDFLSAGTHLVESKLTAAQLGSVISRAESLLVFLLQLGSERP
jgi:hypothetical protein